MFNILMPNSANNAKKAKIKSKFKTAFFQYQYQEVGIKAARIFKEKEDVLETQLNVNNKELLNVKLYQSRPLELDTKTKLTQYLKLLLMLQETNIYNF